MKTEWMMRFHQYEVVLCDIICYNKSQTTKDDLKLKFNFEIYTRNRIHRYRIFFFQ